MNIHIINPNTTGEFTERLLLSAQKVANEDTVVTASSPVSGTPSVESHVEEAIAALGVISEIEVHEKQGIDGYVVACFGDTGVAAAREVAKGPVVGMTEAAYFGASLVAATFSVITLPPRTLVHAKRVLNDTIATHRCARIRAIDLEVADCANEDDVVFDALLAEARIALVEDECEAIVLGCAGLSHLVDQLAAALQVPVIDGVTVAVKIAESLVRLGLHTSKHSTFASPANSLGAIWPNLKEME